MAELTSMLNIGREMSRKLKVVGVNSAEELAALGAEAAFLQLKMVYPRVCLVHLYVLEGAITNQKYNCLSEKRKKELRAFSDFLKSSKQKNKC